MKARILTKENISQMRCSALAMIAKSNYLEYRSKQMELINDIASVVHVFGLNSCVRTSAEEHKARLSETLNKFFDELERIANKNPFKN